MVLKISPSPSQTIAPSNCEMGVGPFRCICHAGGTPHKHHLQIVQPRSPPSAFGQSHATVGPDRP
ncbi:MULTISPECIES: hypothetical protein [unclassified Microcoleus]|uniref:hypothetical protein n=1 Tax=unclassified Microcoleus TaxID=2642155 RepID=UPI002FD06783